MNIKLLGDRLLVKMDPLREKSDAGILYPNKDAVTENDIYVWGTVEQVGNGKYPKNSNKRVPVDVKVGDRVLFVRYLHKVETNKSLQCFTGEDRIILKEEDILCAE